VLEEGSERAGRTPAGCEKDIKEEIPTKRRVLAQPSGGGRQEGLTRVRN